jgi:hypothetical protein
MIYPELPYAHELASYRRDTRNLRRAAATYRWKRSHTFRILKALSLPFLLLLGSRKAERSIILAVLSVSVTSYV